MMEWEGDILIGKILRNLGESTGKLKAIFQEGSESDCGKIPFKPRQSLLSLLGDYGLLFLTWANGCPSSKFIYFQFQMTSSIRPRASSYSHFLRERIWPPQSSVHLEPQQQCLGMHCWGCLLPTLWSNILLPCVKGQEQGGRPAQVLK